MADKIPDRISRNDWNAVWSDKTTVLPHKIEHGGTIYLVAGYDPPDGEPYVTCCHEVEEGN